MAYATAAGYENLPSGNFVPVIYSQKGSQILSKIFGSGSNYQHRLFW